MQLLIIDIQNTYRSHCYELINKVPDFSKNFAEVFYLYDNISGQELYEEVPEEWMEEEGSEFYDSLKIITKQYAFFRGLMDAGVDSDDEEFVKLAKFMIKHNVIDSRDILDQEEIYEIYKEEFKHSPLNNVNFNDYGFYLPEDLIIDIEENIKSGVVLVGGGRNECLKEVALLLRVLDIKFTIQEDYTY